MVQQTKKNPTENTPDEQKSKYELMTIIVPDLSQEDIEKQLKKIRGQIKDLKGEIYHEDLWDVRDLAYEIKKHDKGFYIVFYFTFEPVNIAELEKELLLDAKVLRHLIVKSPREYKIKNIAEIEKEAKKKSATEKKDHEAKLEKPVKESEKPEIKEPESEKPEVKKEAEAPKEAPEEAPKEAETKVEKEEEAPATKKPMDISDLDSQLESILEDPDIDIKL